MRFLKVAFTTVTLFMLCWLPFSTCNMLKASSKSRGGKDMERTLFTLAFFNSVLNPFIYFAYMRGVISTKLRRFAFILGRFGKKRNSIAIDDNVTNKTNSMNNQEELNKTIGNQAGGKIPMNSQSARYIQIDNQSKDNKPIDNQSEDNIPIDNQSEDNKPIDNQSAINATIDKPSESKEPNGIESDIELEGYQSKQSKKKKKTEKQTMKKLKHKPESKKTDK